jgi:adenylylsulfate kinase
MQEKGFVLWLTGLSGAGKTTIARAVEQELKSRDRLVEVLDGDIIRAHLCQDLGFSRVDRDMNIRRIGFVANLLSRNGVATIVSAISPFRDIREELRQTVNHFIEVYINAPLEVCESRDVKGLYAKARTGEIKSFTGIDSPYEAPTDPEIICYTAVETLEESVLKIITALEQMELIALEESLLLTT